VGAEDWEITVAVDITVGDAFFLIKVGETITVVGILVVTVRL